MKSHYEVVKLQPKRELILLKVNWRDYKMIAQDEYCIDLLNQSLAIQNSLKSLDSLLLKRHLQTHVAHQMVEEKEKAVNEIVTLFKRINK